MTNKGVDHHCLGQHSQTHKKCSHLLDVHALKGVASSKLVEASFKAIDIESYLTFIQFHK